LPETGVVAEDFGGVYEFVQFFATRRSEIKKSARRLLQSAAPGALVWVTYPKKNPGVHSDLSRVAVWAAMEGTGWRPVSQIADKVDACPLRCTRMSLHIHITAGIESHVCGVGLQKSAHRRASAGQEQHSESDLPNDQSGAKNGSLAGQSPNAARLHHLGYLRLRKAERGCDADQYSCHYSN
jgi:hypothetical protein